MSWPTFQYKPPPLYFMHVRKTAGTTWHDVLKVAYYPQAVPHITVGNPHRYSLADLGRFRAFRSHFGPGLLPCIEQPGMVSVTMLRDPIEQFVSQLYFKQSELKRHPEKIDPANAEQVYPLLDADLRTLIVNSLLLTPDNPQTCNLGVVRDYLPFFQPGTRMQLELTEQEYRVATNMHPIAACAHAQLDRMAVVGITENFAASTALLCDLLGVPQPQVLPQKNVGAQRESMAQRYRDQLPPDLLEQIVAKTPYDQVLYAHACERFAEQHARYRAYPRRTYSIAPRLRAFSQLFTTVGRSALRRLAKTPIRQFLRTGRMGDRKALGRT